MRSTSRAFDSWATLSAGRDAGPWQAVLLVQRHLGGQAPDLRRHRDDDDVAEMRDHGIAGHLHDGVSIPRRPLDRST
jgi:hypothetical protein